MKLIKIINSIVIIILSLSILLILGSVSIKLTTNYNDNENLILASKILLIIGIILFSLSIVEIILAFILQKVKNKKKVNINRVDKKEKNMENYKLYNGILIPKIGLGTWQSAYDDCYNACLCALKCGYRHIDTALVYENEGAVGKALEDSGLKREEVFITTKLPAEFKGYEITKEKFNESLKNLKTDYIDLYLIHAPWPWSDQGGNYEEGNIESWKAMIELYNEGKIKAIGVSNFNKEQIEALIKATGVKPMVNQIRYFIGNTQDEITKYCQENDILVEAYSPLATGELLSKDILNNIAKKYNTTISQVCLDFCLKNNTLPLPKSIHEERIIDNLTIKIDLKEEDMEELNKLYHIGSTRKYRS